MKHKRGKEEIEYINLPCSFDIETSSFYEGDEKRACMYAFVFCVNGQVVLGRTWKRFLECCKFVQDYYQLNEKRRMIIYIHNFSYEWQFFCKRLKWSEVFATAPRNPVKALCSYGIEFRDSYILSGLSLASTAKNLLTYKVEKLKGSLDYSLIRHSKTPLSVKEWHYLINDGLAVTSFIKESMEKNGNNITKIPLTNTGYVRNYLRDCCYYQGRKSHNSTFYANQAYGKYRKLMERLTIEPREYIFAKEGFQGGFTHGNIFNVGRVFHDCGSGDICSDYPSIIALERMPMGKGTYLKTNDQKKFEEKLKYYCCLFRCKLKNVKSRWRGDHFISLSKCRNIKEYEEDNGRIMSAKELETTMTEIDLEICRKFYTFKIEILEMYYYPRGYLPKAFVEGVLKLYGDKTTLKGVEGEEVNYMHSKSMLNASYGCSVTDILQEVNEYVDGEWVTTTPALEEAIEKYNADKKRFLFYLWGVYITAHARNRIASLIEKLGDDYIYSDTDSVKYCNREKHADIYAWFNNAIDKKISKVCSVMGYDHAQFSPKTKEGVAKTLGYLEEEEPYKRFKTLGAKRYLVEYYHNKKYELDDDTIFETPYSLTISGVNKFVAIPYIVKKLKKDEDIFDLFQIGYTFNEEACGKLTHTYIDKEIKGEVKDYLGNTAKYAEKSYIHLEKASYKISTKEDYAETLLLDEEERKEKLFI